MSAKSGFELLHAGINERVALEGGDNKNPVNLAGDHKRFRAIGCSLGVRSRNRHQLSRPVEQLGLGRGLQARKSEGLIFPEMIKEDTPAASRDRREEHSHFLPLRFDGYKLGRFDRVGLADEGGSRQQNQRAGVGGADLGNAFEDFLIEATPVPHFPADEAERKSPYSF